MFFILTSAFFFGLLLSPKKQIYCRFMLYKLSRIVSGHVKDIQASLASRYNRSFVQQLPYCSDRDEGQLVRGTSGSAGLDLSLGNFLDRVNGIDMYDTSISVAIPPNHFGLVVPRSSLHKKGYCLANTVGIIDSDYRGSIKLALLPMTEDHEPLELGLRVAQLIILPYANLTPVRVVTLSETKRQDGGFGSTGS